VRRKKGFSPLSFTLVRCDDRELFSAGAQSRTHPLGSVTRDQLAVNASGGEAVCRSVCLSLCHQRVARSHQWVDSLSLTAFLSLSLSLVGPSFQDLSIPLSLFSFPLSFYCSVSASLRLLSSLSLFHLPLLLIFLLSIFRSLRTHTLYTAPFSLSVDSLFSLVNRRYVDVPIENREEAHHGERDDGDRIFLLLAERPRRRMYPERVATTCIRGTNHRANRETTRGGRALQSG